MPRFLCLAYGRAEPWEALSEEKRQELLAQDERIREAGHLMAAVEAATSVRLEDGEIQAEPGPTETTGPLAGFSVIEAETREEVVELVAGTPCGTVGVIEVWRLREEDAG